MLESTLSRSDELLVSLKSVACKSCRDQHVVQSHVFCPPQLTSKKACCCPTNKLSVTAMIQNAIVACRDKTASLQLLA